MKVFSFRFVHAISLFAASVVVVLPAGAEVKLPTILSDHMVLKKSEATPLWGWADPGEKVVTTLNSQRAEAQADSEGRWKTSLDLTKSGPGPHELVVEGKNRIVIRDVVVGEVWLASGQSNMGFRQSKSIGGKEDAAKSANPFVREFAVGFSASARGMEDCDGQWLAANPETTPLFSGVAYYFARMLQKELAQPVGIINASVGGTEAESWTRAEAVDGDPELKARKDANLQPAEQLEKAKRQFARDFGAWLKTSGREDKATPDPEAYAGETVPMDGWEPVTLPGKALKGPGTVWLRKEINMPKLAPNYPGRINLQIIDGLETLYWNGKKVGETTLEEYAEDGTRGYIVPQRWVREGKNVIAVRIFSPAVPPTIRKGTDTMAAMTESLAGEWMAKAECEFPPLAGEVLSGLPKAPPHIERRGLAGYLFNGMVHPVTPYGISGIIWYQGESNAKRALQYQRLLSVLIQDWRSNWGGERTPFYFCQLPNFGTTKPAEGPDSWAVLRDSQTAVAAALPNTAQVVLIDIGEETQIHPRNKRDAGERLARIALAKTYGRDIVFSGPVFRSLEVEGPAIRVRFTHTDGGLAAKPLPATYQPSSLDPETKPLQRNSPSSELEGFAICGKDGKWVWADAKIDGESVIVRSPEVAQPVAVRYAWANNPVCNLFNGAGLPAAPFRSDKASPDAAATPR